MYLCKKLMIAFLCSSLSNPICIAMEQIKIEEEINEIRGAEKNYNTAVLNLNSYLINPNAPSADLYFENIVKYTNLSVEKSYSPAQKLLNVLNSLGNLELAKSSLQKIDLVANMRVPLDELHIYGAFYTQIFYTVKRFHNGMTYLLPLLETDYAETQNLLLSIFETSPDAISHFEETLNLVFNQDNKTKEIKEKIQSIFLDALCKVKAFTNRLNPTIFNELSARYWRVFSNLEAKKEYLEQAIYYSLLCAKTYNDPLAVARGRLITIINTQKAYDIYYSFLMPFLEAGDVEAQVLFNEVAYAVPEAINWFDKHFLNLSKKGEITKIQDIAITKILREYPQFLRIKRRENSTIGAFSHNSLKALDYQPNKISTPNFFAGEKSNVAIFAGLTDEEKKLSPKDLYKLGMKFMNKNNLKSICALLRAEEGRNKDAIKKLKDYRKSKIYKDGETTNKKDSIEHSLYIEDKNRKNLVTFEKKESKTVSPSVQIVRSSHVSSQGKQRHQKNNQKEKSEEISATAPVSTNERRLQKSEPFESLESIIKEPNAENKPTATICLESMSTPIFEVPQINLEELQSTIVANLRHEVQEIKEPIYNIEIKNDQLPTESQEESMVAENAIDPSKITLERKIRKTLSRRQSLIFEKPTKNEETHKPTKMQRTRSLMNLKTEFQDTDAIPTEEPKKKKKKEPSTKISLRKYLPTLKSARKLERQKSQSNLLELTPETSQSNKQADQANKPSHSFKKLTRSLSDRDLKRKSNIPLTESVITSTLNEFQDQGIIEWTRSGNTISATKKDDPTVHLTIHTHDNSDKSWSEKPEIRTDFLEFSSECDEDLKETISQIGRNKSFKK